MHNFTPLSGLIGGALIGLAAAMLMLLSGRLAGVSGILGGAAHIQRRSRLAPCLHRGADRRRRGRSPVRGAVARAPRLVKPGGVCGRGPSGRLRQPDGQWLYLRSRRLRLCPALDAFDHGHRGVHGGRGRNGGAGASRLWRVMSCSIIASFYCRTRLRRRSSDLRHDRAFKSHRLPRHLRRVGRNACLRDGRRGRRQCRRLCAGAPPQRARSRLSALHGLRAATSMRRWSSARRCSGSAGACPEFVRDRRWSISQASARRSSSLLRRWCLACSATSYGSAGMPRAVPQTPRRPRRSRRSRTGERRRRPYFLSAASSLLYSALTNS